MERNERAIIYDGFEIKFPDLVFCYVYGEKKYLYNLRLSGIDKKDLVGKSEAVLKNIQFHIGMMIIPYLFCLDDFDRIIIKPYKVDKNFIDFFTQYYQYGMAEFRYLNNLDVRKKIFIESQSAQKMEDLSSEVLSERALFFNSGGKDSAVGAEILNDIEIPYTIFTWRPSKSSLAKIELLKNNSLGSVFAILDYGPKIVAESIKYKGEKPFIGLLAFTGLFVSYILNLKYLAISNEYSANFGNLIHQGIEVNHQYDKSYEFEMMFDGYAKRNILSQSHYFSILAPLYEIQVAKIFSKLKKYHLRFLSCNVGQYSSQWCRNCPKCAFIFLVLYSFLKKNEMIEIFGGDWFYDKSIRKHIVDLCLAEIKPFECVGTREECKLALYLSLENNPLLKKEKFYPELHDCLVRADIGRLKEEHLYEFHRENHFPREFEKKIRAFFRRQLRA